MGFFDRKWIVIFEYSEGSFFSSFKKGSIVVEASSEYSAKDRAKVVLKNSDKYKSVKILSAMLADSKGRPIVNPVPQTPIRKEPLQNKTETHRRELTPEEKAAEYRRIEREFAEEERRQKERATASIQKQIRKAKNAPVKSAIIAGIVSAFTFLLGWIPHWIYLNFKGTSEDALGFWLDLGHSKSDSFGKELVAQIAEYDLKARNTLWIPFVVLGIGIIVVLLVYSKSKKNVPDKVAELEEKLSEIK